MHFDHFWPPRNPGGCQGGEGRWDQNCQLFVGPHLGSKILIFSLNWKHFISQVFGQKQPLRRPKMAFFWAEMGVHKSAFFSKTPSLKCLKMHHNKVLGSIFMWEKFWHQLTPSHNSRYYFCRLALASCLVRQSRGLSSLPRSSPLTRTEDQSEWNWGKRVWRAESPRQRKGWNGLLKGDSII